MGVLDLFTSAYEVLKGVLRFVLGREIHLPDEVEDLESEQSLTLAHERFQNLTSHLSWASIAALFAIGQISASSGRSMPLWLLTSLVVLFAVGLAASTHFDTYAHKIEQKIDGLDNK